MSSGASDAVMRQKPARVPGSARQQGRRRNGRTVYVGLSGGVDSSVSAALLKQQGYNVVGVYMKNWTKDLPGMPCPWKEDFQDAKRVAVQLGIDFKVYDFEKQYFDKVVKYMIEGFEAGFTPNPDIMCNQEIKFKLFLDAALEDGADLIATGHYARIALSQKPRAKSEKAHNSRLTTQGLFMAKDANKDQTYFLYRVTKEALAKTVFPLGEYTKPQVRQLAKKFNLVTADKKESMGICFVGKVGIKDFLRQYVKEKPGPIIDQVGREVGQHEGAIFYTIGQRHGLDVGGGLPYYVVGKDMKKNEVYVTTDLQDEKLWSKNIKFTSAHWINGEPHSLETQASRHEPKSSRLAASDLGLRVRLRHRSELIKMKDLKKLASGQWLAKLQTDARALTPGQSAVFYSGTECLGGGIVV